MTLNSPREGPRHRSWASDTVIVAIVFGISLLATVLTDATNGPDKDAPAYLIALVGASSAALFGAVSSDKGKREKEIAADTRTALNRTQATNETAVRAEAKADELVKFARSEHPHSAEADALPNPLIPPSAPDESREG